MGSAVVVIGKVHDIAAPRLANDQSVLRDVVVGSTVDRFAVADTIHVISVGNGFPVAGCRGELPAILPAKAPTSTVVVAQGVANCIIGDALPVKGSQQVKPFTITIGVGMRLCTRNATDISVSIIGIVISSLGVDFLGQLALNIIGIAGRLISSGSASYRRNIDKSFL